MTNLFGCIPLAVTTLAWTVILDFPLLWMPCDVLALISDVSLNCHLICSVVSCVLVFWLEWIRLWSSSFTFLTHCTVAVHYYKMLDYKSSMQLYLKNSQIVSMVTFYLIKSWCSFIIMVHTYFLILSNIWIIYNFFSSTSRR